jgi:hypothetical protein
LTDLVGGLRLVSSVNLDHIFNSNNSGETVEEADSGSFGRVKLGYETQEEALTRSEGSSSSGDLVNELFHLRL